MENAIWREWGFIGAIFLLVAIRVYLGWLSIPLVADRLPSRSRRIHRKRFEARGPVAGSPPVLPGDDAPGKWRPSPTVYGA